MGRGRAKAKQTKVARELKYSSPNTDLSALERELHGSTTTRREPERSSDVDKDVDKEEWAPAEGGEYDEYGKWASGER